MSSAEENMALARRFLEARGKADLDAMEQMMAPDFVDHTLAPGQQLWWPATMVASTTPTASGLSSTPASSSLRTSRMAYAPPVHILTQRPVSHTLPEPSRNSRSTRWP
jgi:hypothetical protein